MNLLVKINENIVGKLKSIYIKLMLNFIQIFSMLNFFNEFDQESVQKSINTTFEISSGYFFNIISIECLFQSKTIIFIKKFLN